MDRNVELKALCDRVLYGFALFDYLHTIGKSHIIGSYKMNIMAIPDLDIAVENEDMSLEKLYATMNHIFKTIRPTSIKADEIVNKNGKKEWTISFTKDIKNEKLNVDICFISKQKIDRIEVFCEQMSKLLSEEARLATIEIKQQLVLAQRYNGNPYTSSEVYDAVVNRGIRSYQQFLEKYK